MQVALKRQKEFGVAAAVMQVRFLARELPCTAAVAKKEKKKKKIKQGKGKGSDVERALNLHRGSGSRFDKVSFQWRAEGEQEASLVDLGSGGESSRKRAQSEQKL